jgi:hypothetical protein
MGGTILPQPSSCDFTGIITGIKLKNEIGGLNKCWYKAITNLLILIPLLIGHTT